MSNKVKILELMNEFHQISCREVDDKMVLSVWIDFSTLKDLTGIMSYSFFCDNPPSAKLLYDCVYLNDFMPFLDGFGFSEEEINTICNKYEEK